MGTNLFILCLLISLSFFTRFPGGESVGLYSSRLIHRFSDEAVSFWALKGRNVTPPKGGSLEHMRVLFNSDFKRQRLKLGSQDQLLIPSQGGRTYFYGNDLDWLHYTWIDIGTPNTSFLVALDAGSDLFWVPCSCVQCAPLSSSYYSVLDRDLSEYNPLQSSTSRHLSCSHQLCQLSSSCQTPKEHCPYSVSYLSENTSSSGFLYEDQMHLTSMGPGGNKSSLKASVIVGCGSKQSGTYLDGSAPDGLMGLGPGGISVPSLLAKTGVIPHSFSFCFDESYSGSIYFGDQGPENQRTTLFVPYQEQYVGYFVKVEKYCIGSSCLKETAFQAQVDSGSSFTYLPQEAYDLVVAEFDEQVNATKSGIEDFPYCYKASARGRPEVPDMRFIFATNQSFVIEGALFNVNNQGIDLYCLGLLPMDGDMGIIGQNLLQGYRVVFDWENLKLGWSHSNCEEIGKNNNNDYSTPPQVNPLPSNEQQRNPNGHAVAPAVAGKTPLHPSTSSPPRPVSLSCNVILMLLQLTLRLSDIF